MNDLIFGLTWEQIKLAQNKQPYRANITKTSSLPIARKEDIVLLEEKGLTWLQNNGYHGVIDRLKNSKLI